MATTKRPGNANAAPSQPPGPPAAPPGQSAAPAKKAAPRKRPGKLDDLLAKIAPGKRPTKARAQQAFDALELVVGEEADHALQRRGLKRR